MLKLLLLLRETCAELTQGFVICVASLHDPRPIACQAPASSVVPASAAPCSSLVQSGCYWSVKQEWPDLARCHMEHDRRVVKAKAKAAAAAHDDDGGGGATASASALVVGEIDKEASGAAKEKNEATASIPSEEHDSETARNDSETKRNHALIVQQMLTLTNRQYEGTDTLTSEDTTTLLQHLSLLLNNEHQDLTGTRGATEAPKLSPSQKMAKGEHLRHATKPVLLMGERSAAK